MMRIVIIHWYYPVLRDDIGNVIELIGCLIRGGKFDKLVVGMDEWTFKRDEYPFAWVEGRFFCCGYCLVDGMWK